MTKKGLPEQQDQSQQDVQDQLNHNAENHEDDNNNNIFAVALKADIVA